MTRFRYFVALLILIFATAFLWLVWPSRYRYDRWKEQASDVPVRMDRLTGRTEMLTSGGWVVVGHSEAQDQDLPRSDLERLEGQCSINQSNFIECDIYNGSIWKLSSITVAISNIEQNDWVTVHSSATEKRRIPEDRPDFIPEIGPFSRNFKLIAELYQSSGAPLTNTKFTASVGPLVGSAQTRSWKIVAARGARSQ